MNSTAASSPSVASASATDSVGPGASSISMVTVDGEPTVWSGPGRMRTVTGPRSAEPFQTSSRRSQYRSPSRLDAAIIRASCVVDRLGLLPPPAHSYLKSTSTPPSGGPSVQMRPAPCARTRYHAKSSASVARSEPGTCSTVSVGFPVHVLRFSTARPTNAGCSAPPVVVSGSRASLRR